MLMLLLMLVLLLKLLLLLLLMLLQMLLLLLLLLLLVLVRRVVRSRATKRSVHTTPVSDRVLPFRSGMMPSDVPYLALLGRGAPLL